MLKINSSTDQTWILSFGCRNVNVYSRLVSRNLMGSYIFAPKHSPQEVPHPNWAQKSADGQINSLVHMMLLGSSCSWWLWRRWWLRFCRVGFWTFYVVSKLACIRLLWYDIDIFAVVIFDRDDRRLHHRIPLWLLIRAIESAEEVILLTGDLI